MLRIVRNTLTYVMLSPLGSLETTVYKVLLYVELLHGRAISGSRCTFGAPLSSNGRWRCHE